MMRLLEILSDPSWSRLVCALLHSLWQAPLLAARRPRRYCPSWPMNWPISAGTTTSSIWSSC